MLRQNEVLATAARHGAFVASRDISMFTFNGTNIACGNAAFDDAAPPLNPNPMNCQDILVDDPPAPPLLNQFRIGSEVCEYLRGEQFELEKWDVTVALSKRSEGVDGVLTEFPFVEVNVSLNEDERGCVVCLTWPLNTSWLGSDVLWGEARYPLGGTCV